MQRKCVIDWCQRERVRDALYCSAHLNDLWHNRPVVTDARPEWVRRMESDGLPAKDYTRSRAA